jgi:hypothetical protein
MPKRATKPNPYERKTRRTRVKRTKAETAFPASEQTPGQPKSREAFEAFEQHHESFGWWADYAHLRNEGFTWRVAAYIAWSSSPLQRRWPTTLKELAAVLGLKSDKVIYKWRKLDPTIDARVEAFRAEPLLRYRSDVLFALIDVASTHDPSAHNDRKMFLEITGDYKPRQAMELSGADGGPVRTLNLGDVASLTDDELERFIANLQTIAGDAGDRADGTGGEEEPHPQPLSYEERGVEPAGVDGAPARDVDAGAAV